MTRRLALAGIVAAAASAACGLWSLAPTWSWLLAYGAIVCGALVAALPGALLGLAILTLGGWLAPQGSPWLVLPPTVVHSLPPFGLVAVAVAAGIFARPLRTYLVWLGWEALGLVMRPVLDGAREPVLMFGPDQRILYANPLAGQLLGRSPTDLCGLRLEALALPEQAEHIADVQKDLLNVRLRAAELILARSDGVSFPAEFVAIVLPTVRTVAMLRDLTERKRDEADLQDSQAQWRAMVDDAAPDALFIHDGHGRVVDVNRRACETLGYTRQELLAMDVRDIEVSMSGEDVLAIMGSMQPGAPITQRGQHRRKDGTTFPVELRLALVARPVGSLVVAVARDIRERVAAEEERNQHLAELQRHREHLQLLVAEQTADLAAKLAELRDNEFALDRAGMGIVWLEPTSGRFVYANPAAGQLLGVASDRLLGMHLRDVPYCRDLTEQLRQIPECDQPIGSRFELEVGEPEPARTLAVNTFRLPPDGDRPARLIAFFADISERRHVERALRHAKEVAEASAAATSAFLANMSHEIRTPLNGILGMAHLLRHGSVTAGQADKLDTIAAAGRHLSRLIDDILDLSRIAANKLELREQPFELGSLLRDVAAVIDAGARGKGLQVNLQCADEPVWLSGDITRLKQGLLNYAGNAVKFTDHGSITLVAAASATMDSGVLVRFEVRDTGRGVSPETLEKLFRPFEQGDATATREHGGTGLGLAITLRLARLMGGNAGATSRVGEGSCFWFTARLQPAEAPRLEAPVLHGPDARHELLKHFAGDRVLVVEDDLINQEVATSMLEAVGLKVDLAANGAEGVELASSGRYVAILMDMQMPVLDGIAATEAIRRLPSLDQLPILALTANAFDLDRQRCLRAGMNDFIAKPIDPATLYETLLLWLPRSRPAPAETGGPQMQRQLDDTPAGDEIPLAVAGLDAQAALMIVNGKPARLVHLLHTFCDNHGHDAERLHDLMAKGAEAEAMQLAHQLKGSAGTLALRGIFEHARHIESDLRLHQQAEVVEPELQVLEHALTALCIDVSQLADPVAGGRESGRSARDVLAKLADLLAASDTSANVLVVDERAVLTTALGTRGYQALAAAIEHFDYPQALRLMDPGAAEAVERAP